MIMSNIFTGFSLYPRGEFVGKSWGFTLMLNILSVSFYSLRFFLIAPLIKALDIIIKMKMMSL